MSVILSVSDAEKSLGARTLFQALSFGLDEGARVGLVGPNGSGKSTLLKILAGRDNLDRGHVVWSKRVHVEYVEQSPNPRPEISLEDFLFEGSRVRIEDPRTAALMWESFSRLNVTGLDLSQKFNDLSGGTRKKAQIVRAILNEPQVLLMDEPTNHLDIESIMWVEDFLKSRTGMTLLLISHDRLFLQNVVSEILELNPQYREGYIRSRGGYAEYLELKDETARTQRVHQQRRENDLRRETAWLRRGAIARQTKQSARQQAAAELSTEVETLKSLNRNRDLEIELKSSSRSPQKLVELENVTLSRGDQVLVKGLNLMLHRRTRLGLLGRNGSGKSSLIQALLRIQTQGLEISAGKIRRYEDLKVSYFEQHRSHLNPEKTLLRSVCPEGDYVHVRGQPIFAKSYLDRFQFRRDQHDLKVKELSGGEQNRLVMAMMMTQEAQLMVLDEPTNDLDFDTLESLRKALVEFDGAMVLVSHDRAFLDEVCDEILYFPEERESVGQLVKFQSFLQWQDWKLKAAGSVTSTARKSQDSESAVSKSPTSPETRPRKLSYLEQREYDQIEGVILDAETQLASLQLELEKPETVSDSTKLVQLTQEYQTLSAKIEQLYARWQYFESKKG
ncbi:MAG: ABC-F family ATP-binding cassette domain-containing protein [Bdellovibrionales bacterium]